MHFVRRAALRAASNASFVSKPRTINTTSPFVVRASNERISSAVFRRFASDDAHTREENADAQEEGAVRSAINSAAETVSEYASEAKETVAQATGFGSRNAGFGRDRNVERPSIDPNNGVYIGNLLFDITEEDLKKEFEHFGTITDVRVTRDARGLSKGFAYIDFADVQSATAAIEAKNQTIFEGRRLVVNYVNKTPKIRDQNPPSKCLFIGNLAFEMSDADLNSLFREVRNVIDVRVAIDRRTGQPRGFAHADFVDVDSAMKALEQLQGKEVFNRRLRVDYSLGERSAGGGERNDRGFGNNDRGGRGSYGGGRRDRGGYGGDRGDRGGYGGDRGDRGGYGGDRDGRGASF
ncbi:uncharacterized protein EAF01_000668 [Botrytis porri]|uniref:uncharacterized protein n=1 Tax=Botrytis porri TaxID=87229 RepID=UPI0018FF17E2|nr:uncharacterized protein EAF01_000668 [Botrytis porri]KAF7914262.1 hypothetical protein EAF01_000668 [Botrytis porri]